LPREVPQTSTWMPKPDTAFTGTAKAAMLKAVVLMLLLGLLTGCAQKRPFATDWSEPDVTKRQQFRSARLAEAVTRVSGCKSLPEAALVLGVNPDRFADLTELTFQLSDAKSPLPKGSQRAAVWTAGLQTNDPSNNWREELWVVLSRGDAVLKVFSTIVPG
jgi:hypothetical protein